MAINNTAKNPFQSLLSGLVPPKTSSLSGYVPAQKPTMATQTNQKLGIGTPESISKPSTVAVQAPKSAAPTGMSIPEYQAAVAAKNNNNNTPTIVQDKQDAVMSSGIKGMVSPTAPSPQTTKYGGYVENLASYGNPENRSKALEEANNAYQKSIENLQKFKESVSNKKAAIYDAPTSARIMQGRDAALQQANAEIFAGLESAATRAQQGVGYALTEQGQQIGAVRDAAGLAAPSGNYPFVFDPLTGGFTQAGGSSSILTPQQAAQAVMSGSMTYEQAKTSLGYLGGTGVAQLDSAITSSGGNPLQLQAQGQATQSNISTQQTAAIDIARAGLQTATNDYMQMYGAAQFAGTQSEAVNNILAKTGLNNVGSTDYTRVLNNLRSRFSNEDWASLNTALREAQFAYSNLLSTGGSTPTTNDERAMAALNIDQSASVIKASIQQLENAVARRLQAQNSVLQQYQQNLGGQQQQVAAPTQPGGSGLWNW
jgi:hypothetical protein